MLHTQATACQLHQEDQDGNAVKDDQGKPVEISYIKYKACAVFNVADLQAKDDKAQAALDAKILELAGNSADPKPLACRNEAARTQLNKWVVDVKHYGDRAFYSPSADKITMPKETAFTSEGAYLSTLSHEMITAQAMAAGLAVISPVALARSHTHGRSWSQSLVPSLFVIVWRSTAVPTITPLT